MKIPITLLDKLLLEAGRLVDVSVERDLATIRGRIEHEGMSFLTITLPSLCDALDRGLADGRISPPLFMGFRPLRRSGSLPTLLSGFFIRVFDVDGWLLPSPCIDSIEAIRQVTRFFKKVELPCSAARVKRAYERYISNDQFVSKSNRQQRALLRHVAGILWTPLNAFASGTLYGFPACFGGGATGEHLSANRRWTLTQWPERGSDLFPVSIHGSHSEADVSEFESIEFLDRASEQPVRVVTVPKTLKTPRIISVEPSYMMLRQQSIAKPLMAYLELNIPNNVIRFSSQMENRDLARVGSTDGSLATIDLSDASDLVSNNLVGRVFRSCPDFLALLQGSRSTRAILPDGSVKKLNRFASMGSATCFPVEAMVFYTLVVTALVHQSGRRPSMSLISELTANCSVYGDDIIVRSETVPVVCEYLEAFGLKVNRSKSFSTGLFRESCGGDYYAGHNVTPIYLRRLDTTDTLRDAADLASWVSTANQFYLKGWWGFAAYLRSYVEQRRGSIPLSTHDCGGLSWRSCFLDTHLHWDKHNCGWKVRTHVLRAPTSEDPVESIRAAMLLSFQPSYVSERIREIRNHSPSRAIDHLFPRQKAPDTGMSVRPYALTSKRRWIPVKTGISSW